MDENVAINAEEGVALRTDHTLMFGKVCEDDMLLSIATSTTECPVY